VQVQVQVRCRMQDAGAGCRWIQDAFDRNSPKEGLLSSKLGMS